MAQKHLSLPVILKKNRVKSGLTQKDVSRQLGYGTPQFISNWERGVSYPPSKALRKISRLYGVPIDRLYDALVAQAVVSLKQGLRREIYGER